MTKGLLQLYIDRELVELAKSRGVNISRLFNEILTVELQYKELSDTTNKDELISKLKAKVGILTDEVKIISEKNTIQSEEIKNLTKELEELKKKKLNQPEIKGRVLWTQ